MKPEIVRHLLEINRRFYDDFGAAFAATRQRIQPGMRRVLTALPMDGSWLDLGCGSGALAAEWAQHTVEGSYWGLDSSHPLLDAARRSAGENISGNVKVRFNQCDLADLDFPPGDPAEKNLQPFSGIFCFAVLHHLPSTELRRAVLCRSRQLLTSGGSLIHSVWQFKHSPRLLARVQPWGQVGISPSDVDEGDTLLDWRYTLRGQAQTNGLRYVHHFSGSELAELAAESGFQIIEEFESDGEGGRLGLYQVWQAQP